MKHTKGPWAWGPKLRDVLAESERGDEIHGARYWRTIASLELTGPAPRHKAEVEANGLLIAAAPDIFEALTDLERAATAMYRVTGPSANYGHAENRFADDDPNIIAARAALAKAQGDEAESAERGDE